MTVFTIGYEGLNIDMFMSLLSEHDIATVVDVRQLPLSRKPGFSKTALASALHLFGLAYVSMSKLGCPKSVRDRYRADSNWRRYTIGFMAHLKMQEEAITELSHLVSTSNCALLCYEADFNFCHRTLVANAVCNHCGANAKHITMIPTKVTTPALPQMAFA